MSPIEQAYKAWRATVTDDPLGGLVVHLKRPPPWKRGTRATMTNEKPRKYAGTGRYKRTAAHKEANRRGALRRWAKAKSAKLRRVRSPGPFGIELGPHPRPPETFAVERVTPREAILDVLRAKGPMSKAEIIERAGLTPGRKSVPHFSGLLRTKTIRKVGDKVTLAKVR